MEFINKTLDFHVAEPSVITMGKFDGLHRGHETLIEILKEKNASEGLKSIVFTFDIPPKSEVTGVEAKVLTTNEEKRYIFEEAGVDYLIECPFTKEVMCMEPRAFVEWIVKSLNVKCIVVGNDFHFGHKRAGDYQLLQEMSKELSYEVIVLNKLKEDNRDISSTFIREEIAKGNIKKANHLLGYSYFVKGKVVHGKKIGRTIGIPTVNLILSEDKLLPPFGVYATRIQVKDKEYFGVTNVGRKPTIAGNNPIGVETYIIDFSQDVYDEIITVRFTEFLRPEKKFDSIEDLKYQMSADIIKTISYYKNVT